MISIMSLKFTSGNLASVNLEVSEKLISLHVINRASDVLILRMNPAYREGDSLFGLLP